MPYLDPNEAREYRKLWNRAKRAGRKLTLHDRLKYAGEQVRALKEEQRREEREQSGSPVMPKCTVVVRKLAAGVEQRRLTREAREAERRAALSLPEIKLREPGERLSQPIENRQPGEG